jgi:hypothetical protein
MMQRPLSFTVLNTNQRKLPVLDEQKEEEDEDEGHQKSVVNSHRGDAL